jgi:uncharacterized protein YerC
MRRYSFLDKDFIYSALNKLRAAFLAARDGNEVEEIIKAVLTNDERMKIGRRIEVAQMLQAGLTHREIADQLKVGLTTIKLVDRKMHEHPRGYELIDLRERKVEGEYSDKAYKKVGGPKLVFKKREYTGFRRKDVRR